MGYMLETRGLTKRFGRGDQAQDAVADVSLHIRKGEVYGLLGPNGAGKSTTLKMICGMLRPTAGEILFAGHAWRREDLYAIGSLIEEAPLYPNLTARENLRVRTTLLGLPESRIDEVLAAVDLTDTGKKHAGRFSMGMRQRLGLALALIARPRLWIGYTGVDSSGRGARDGRAVYEGPQAPEAFHRRVQEADSRPLQRRQAQARGHGRVRPRQEHRGEAGQVDKRDRLAARRGQPHARAEPDPGARAREPQAPDGGRRTTPCARGPTGPPRRTPPRRPWSRPTPPARAGTARAR